MRPTLKRTHSPLARAVSCEAVDHRFFGRIPLETFSDGIGLDTDYAKNTKHQFAGMNSDNVTFLKTAMDLVSAKAA